MGVYPDTAGAIYDTLPGWFMTSADALAWVTLAWIVALMAFVVHVVVRTYKDNRR